MISAFMDILCRSCGSDVTTCDTQGDLETQVKKWLREPLLHFLLIGAALFLFYGYQNDGFVDHDSRIVISKSDINRLVMLWEKKWQRSPTRVELEGLVEQQIREEVLYREALAMGLDLNDGVVRRRLAQKVEFISYDLAVEIESKDSDLADYLAANPDKFEVPGRISFIQIYLNTDRRGENTERDAQALLNQLTLAESEVDIAKAGDSFMFGQRHAQLSHHGVARLFGNDFADKLYSLPVGAWQGPVPSGHGLHLVLVENRTEAVEPELALVRDHVRNEWIAEQRQSLNEAMYQNLRERYDIVVEEY